MKRGFGGRCPAAQQKSLRSISASTKPSSNPSIPEQSARSAVPATSRIKSSQTLSHPRGNSNGEIHMRPRVPIPPPPTSWTSASPEVPPTTKNQRLVEFWNVGKTANTMTHVLHVVDILKDYVITSVGASVTTRRRPSCYEGRHGAFSGSTGHDYICISATMQQKPVLRAARPRNSYLSQHRKTKLENTHAW